MPFFVYEANFACKAVPSIWHEEQFQAETGKRKPTLRMWTITEEEAKLSVSELAAKYPLEDKK